MLCDEDIPPSTESAPPTPSPAVTTPSGAPGTDKKKKKKTKKKKFSDLMAEMTQGSVHEVTDAAHRQKISRHLGGGTFSKVDKI